MARKILTNLDLANNELYGLRIENIANTSVGTKLSELGSIAYNTTNNYLQYRDNEGLKAVASREWVNSVISSSVGGVITDTERENWNSAYSALFEVDGSNAASVIDTWNEIKAFVASYNNSQDLATILAGKMSTPAQPGSEGDVLTAKSDGSYEWRTRKYVVEKVFNSSNSATSFEENITALNTTDVSVHLYEVGGTLSEKTYTEVLADVQITLNAPSYGGGTPTIKVKISFATAPKNVTYRLVVVG